MGLYTRCCCAMGKCGMGLYTRCCYHVPAVMHSLGTIFRQPHKVPAHTFHLHHVWVELHDLHTATRLPHTIPAHTFHLHHVWVELHDLHTTTGHANGHVLAIRAEGTAPCAPALKKCGCVVVWCELSGPLPALKKCGHVWWCEWWCQSNRRTRKLRRAC